MAYSEGIFHLANVASGSPSLLTSAADISSIAIMEAIQVRRLMLYVTTAPTVTASVVTFYKRSAVGVTGGQVAIGTLTIPVGTAAGSVVYKNIDSVNFSQGSCLAAVVSTASTAGAGLVGVGAYQNAEDPQNVAACKLSV